MASQGKETIGKEERFILGGCIPPIFPGVPLFLLLTLNKFAPSSSWMLPPPTPLILDPLRRTLCGPPALGFLRRLSITGYLGKREEGARGTLRVAHYHTGIFFPPFTTFLEGEGTPGFRGGYHGSFLQKSTGLSPVHRILIQPISPFPICHLLAPFFFFRNDFFPPNTLPFFLCARPKGF